MDATPELLPDSYNLNWTEAYRWAYRVTVGLGRPDRRRAWVTFLLLVER